MTTATPPAQSPADSADQDDADRGGTSEQNMHAQDHPKAEGDPDAEADTEADMEGGGDGGAEA